MNQTSRVKFLDRIRHALGRESDSNVEAINQEFFMNPEPAYRDALSDSNENAKALIDEFKENAESQGWNTSKVPDLSGAKEVLISILNGIECKSIVCTNEQAVNLMDLDKILSNQEIKICKLMSNDNRNTNAIESEQYFRSVAEVADVGITGCDFAVAETGTIVVIPKSGVSRLVSLTPPVYIAIVWQGQVLRSLDELFAVRRYQTINGLENGYMNLISGPSRSGDIENIMIQGVHGPGEVHLILIDDKMSPE